MFKNVNKLYQVQKLDQCQKAAKWAQSLSTGPIGRGSLDSSGLRAITIKLTIWVTSCIKVYFLGKPIITGTPDGFSIFDNVSMQDRGLNFCDLSIWQESFSCRVKSRLLEFSPPRDEIR
jgi:hypothetical protein